MLNQRDPGALFLERRDRFMQKIFLEHEYKKRHFLVTKNMSDYNDVIINLERFIVYSIEDNPSWYNELEDNIRNIKYKNQYNKLSFVNEHHSKLILEAEIESRKKYGVPFYNLMMPEDIAFRLLDSDKPLYPISPEYFDIERIVDTAFLKAILGFFHIKEKRHNFFPAEKDILRKEFESRLDGNNPTRDLALLSAIIKCSNGKDLNKSDKDALLEKMDSYIPEKTRENSFKSRLHGLLYFDYALAITSTGEKHKVNDFISLFSGVLEVEKKKNYSEMIKKSYRDKLKLATQCIQECKVLPTSNTGSTEEIKKIILPEHIPFYHDYISFQKNTKIQKH